MNEQEQWMEVDHENLFTKSGREKEKKKKSGKQA